MAEPPDPARLLGESVGAFVDELVRSGVRHFCVCPGSRSTPLALTIARQPGAKLWMHFDERSAGFFGLGLAKAAREPVALVCTSGTAAANFLPAVVEASLARVPLVVLTADRPRELRDSGAPQTIDQVRLYGSQVRWFFDLEEPTEGEELLRHVRTVACRAVAMARGAPPGPVHVNCPYRDPLIPRPGRRADDDALARPTRRPYVAVESGLRTASPALVQRLSAELITTRRGLIVCGPQHDPALTGPLVELAGRLGYPILADPLSSLRSGPPDQTLVLDAYDAFLRDESFLASREPELVLRFGAMPTSRPVLSMLQRQPPCRQIVVDGAGGWNEPTLRAAEMIQVDEAGLCEALCHVLPPAPVDNQDRADWLNAWCAANRLTRGVLADRLEKMDELFEGKVFAELAELLPTHATLYVGNSMPVRDLDTFFPTCSRPLTIMGNRGANGIDGVVSSALGAAAAGADPLVLVIGDLSLYHDSNGLLAARCFTLNAVIVLLNNDGGGIFSFLPQADEPEHFETLFGTPHGLDFRPLAELYGASYKRVERWDEFRAAVRCGLSEGGLHLVEVPTSRQRNVELHREFWPLVSATLASGR